MRSMFLFALVIFINLLTLKDGQCIPVEYHQRGISEVLSDCIVRILIKHFATTRTLAVLQDVNFQLTPYLFSRYTNPFLNLGMTFAVQSPQLVNKTEFSSWQYERYGVNYMIILQNLGLFKDVVNNLKKLIFWNPRSKFIIFVASENHSIEDIRKVFQFSVAEDIVDIIIISGKGDDFIPESQEYTKETQSFFIHTYFPYEIGCSSEKREFLLDICTFTGLQLNVNLFPNKLQNLYGCPLPLSVMEFIPENIIERDIGKGTVSLRGKFGKLIETLPKVLNFSLTIYDVDYINNYGTKLPNGTYIGTLAALRAGTAGDLLPAVLRQEWSMDFDVIFSMNYIRGVWTVPVRGMYPQWLNIVFPFNTISWSVILIAFVIVSISSNLVERIAMPKSASLQLSLLRNFSILLAISTKAPPKIPLLRTIFFIWVLPAFVLNNLYQASLFGYMTHPKMYPPINTLKQLMECGMPFGGLQRHKYLLRGSTDPVARAIIKNYITVKTIREGYKRVVETRNYAFLFSQDYTEYVMFHKSFTDLEGNPIFHIVPEPVLLLPRFYLFRRGSPLVEVFQRVIQRCDSSGLFLKWHKDVIFSVESDAARDERSKRLKALGISQFSGAYCLLGAGVFLSLIIFIVELLLKFKTMFWNELSGNRSKVLRYIKEYES